MKTLEHITGESFKNIAQGVGALITALGLAISGGIFLWKREWRARLQLSVGVESFIKIAESFLIEPVCFVENKGFLRCYVHQLDLSVRYLLRGEKLEAGDEKVLGAMSFPHSAVQVHFVKPEWKWSYVEAGIRQRYSHVTRVPENAVALLVWAKLYHKKYDQNDFYTAQKVLLIVGDDLVRTDGLPNQIAPSGAPAKIIASEQHRPSD